MNAEDYRQALLDIAHQLTLLATGEAAPTEPPVPVPLPVPTYPRAETIMGAQFYLKAPISPTWQPSQYARVFGKGHILPDPSNAPDGYALRSPAGYPAVYQLIGPMGQEHVVGTARCGYGEHTFLDDAEVAAYIAAVAASQAGAEKRDEETGAEFSGGTAPAGEPETEIKVEQG
jgi:hypothetical protein